jgi:hypothetical protein
MVRNFNEKMTQSFADLLTDSQKKKLGQLVATPAESRQESYNKWILNKALELKVFTDKFESDFTKFSNSGKKFGLMLQCMSCNSVFFEHHPLNPLFKNYVGWFFNTNIFVFPFLVSRSSEKWNLNFEKDFTYCETPNYAPIRVGRKLIPWSRFKYENGTTTIDRSVFSLLPEVDDTLIVGEVMRYLPSPVEFLLVDKAVKVRYYNREHFYFYPLTTLDVYSNMVKEKFSNWELVY